MVLYIKPVQLVELPPKSRERSPEPWPQNVPCVLDATPLGKMKMLILESNKKTTLKRESHFQNRMPREGMSPNLKNKSLLNLPLKPLMGIIMQELMLSLNRKRERLLKAKMQKKSKRKLRKLRKLKQNDLCELMFQYF